MNSENIGNKKVVIVGGVAGGMSAATRLRRLDESAEIVVFERGGYVSFANCGLPYYVGGVIEDRDSLLLQTPEALAARFRLDVRVLHEVTSIDRDQKVVVVRNVETGVEFQEAYDSLVLAAGARASEGLPGRSIPVRTLRTVNDVDDITAILTEVGHGTGIPTSSAARAVVIGAGFIGLEAVENLVKRGLDVTLVQRGSQVLSPLDEEMATPVLDALIARGVDVRLNSTVTGLDDGLVRLDDGSVFGADLVIEARGVQPDAGLAARAGLSVGATGGITVDEHQRTNDPSIYAVGDGVEKVDAVDRAATLVTMAGLANRHGRTAADAICGVSEPSLPALGTAIVGVFDLTVAMVGWSEKRLVAAGRAHRIVHTHPSSHAGYYPGAEQMALKLLIDADTDLILGAQIVGGKGVDKRIDVIATAMTAGLSASRLSQLELAYAPQYGSAKDAVNLAGYVAQNLATGTVSNLQWHELDAARDAGAVLIDVRSAAEFGNGAIDGSVNIPLDELRQRAAELPDAQLVVHCQVGQRGHTAARLLTQLGHRVTNLDGGYKTWVAGTAARSPRP
ncbi:FAD-dependent oxidoreductase [Leifsonia sp. A12D58]|uniref:FAD-dependent oxidoreductase n=1 Tax=Leifsonia sp. A12D58 TaxID=3397674 RepID=UPI0039DF3007